MKDDRQISENGNEQQMEDRNATREEKLRDIAARLSVRTGVKAGPTVSPIVLAYHY